MLAIALPTHRHPPAVGRALTIVYPAKGAVFAVPDKLQLVQLAPGATPVDFGAAFDADDKLQVQRGEERKEVAISKAAIRRDAQARRGEDLPDQMKRSFDDGQFLAFHPSFEDALRRGAPKERDGTPPHDERHDEQVLVAFACPVNREADDPLLRHLAQGLLADRRRKPLGCQPRVMQQARQPFASGFLIALRAGEFGLVAGLLVQDGGDKGR